MIILLGTHTHIQTHTHTNTHKHTHIQTHTQTHSYKHCRHWLTIPAVTTKTGSGDTNARIRSVYVRFGDRYLNTIRLYLVQTLRCRLRHWSAVVVYRFLFDRKRIQIIVDNGHGYRYQKIQFYKRYHVSVLCYIVHFVRSATVLVVLFIILPYIFCYMLCACHGM